ncbi:probable disease resistance protein At5g66910 isoform X2 [Quercus lobata]|uniref:probable disease resistance protein At5g66910 isoform X2 n=1 Tax=Quercus lobata TaxID=97700 RepID=UPI001243D5BA|nr:probable disease resistance protein At5g66910 isoform X2 [Quercus lobata]
MAAAFVAGNVVGAAFGEGFAILHDTVKNVVGQAIVFKSNLEDLKSTLDGVAPVVREIKELSLALNRPETDTKVLIEQMDKGTKLVLKCSKIKRWSWNYCFRAYYYAGKLKELNDAIEKFCRVNLIVQNTRTGLETLTKLNLVLDVRKKYGVGSLSCAVPRPRDFIVGFDLHLKELKTTLFKKEVSLLLLAAPAGCGKTTLVGMLCWDPEIKDYKIMVTSRTAFPRFNSKYNLEPLDHEDAMSLFRHHSAYLQDESSYIPEEYIEKIVRSCGGFPIALEVIGGLFRGRPAEFWRSTVMKWSDDHSIFDSDTEVLLACLQKSLEFSTDKVIIKEYFMDLASFPEDLMIPATALIDMWTELYEPNKDDVYAIANLHELTTRNLVSRVMTRKNASEVDNYYNEDFVKQHNLLRDLAIHMSSRDSIIERKRLIVDIGGNNLLEWWMEQKQQLINARLLSISTDELFSSSWCNILAPDVEVLVLNFQTRSYTLPDFVEKMVRIKVIIVTNYGFFHAELNNFQLLKSLPNLKRIRLEKISIPSFCNTPVPLRSLKKLSLFMCNIGQAFGNSTLKVSDSLPNLMEINIDYCNDLLELPAWLHEVLHLRKLSISNCHKLSALPEGIGELVNLEVLRLRSCTELSELPESIRSLHKLSLLDMSDCLGIIKLPKHIGDLHNLKELHMIGCLRLHNQLPLSTIDLKQLKLVVCDEERAKLWEPIKEFLSDLKVMVVKEDINLNWLPNS